MFSPKVQYTFISFDDDDDDDDDRVLFQKHRHTEPNVTSLS